MGLLARYNVFSIVAMRVVVIMFCIFISYAVQAQNKKPKIVGQKELSTPEGQAITIQLTDLYVEEREGGRDNDDDDGGDRDDDGGDDDKGEKDEDKDKDDDKDKGGKDRGGSDRTAAYPQGYTLEVFNGRNYSVSGYTVRPDQDFIGVLTVEVSVRNDRHTSKKYDLKIAVTPANTPPENKPPVITGQLALSTPQNSPLQIQLTDLKVSDPDDQYPQDFSLQVMTGAKYVVNGTTVIPETGFTGTLTVPVVVNDGEQNSQPFNLKIEVVENANVTPQIAGQIPLSISKNQSVTVVLSHLLVVDPDSSFPADFTLTIFPGDYYSFSGATVNPAKDFTGDLFVKVSVHDGKSSSNVFDLKISIMPAANNKPVITGQAGIKIPQGQSLEIKLSHLVVEDSDNQYPGDFTLLVSEGEYYTLANNSITPEQGFLGALRVKVSVNDGKISSDLFNLEVQVIATDRLEIVGQKSLEIREDSSVVLSLTDLQVNDPSNSYPQGFSLQILRGNNYDIVNSSIKPHRDFYGNLTIPVTISKGGTTSPPFSLLVIVSPVNDAPVLLNLETDPRIAAGPGPWEITSTSEVSDVDDDHLLFAEIRFDQADYQRGKDKLVYGASESINGVFDTETGVLFLLGRATLDEYQTIIRSVKYTYQNPVDSLQLAGARKIYMELHDGNDASPVYERVLMFDTQVALEIPSAFTPNNDHANDTWKITPLKEAGQISAFIRVYDKRGNMVFETSGLETEWDGHFNGSPLPADVYFYTIEMDISRRKVNYKGIVAILR